MSDNSLRALVMGGSGEIGQAIVNALEGQGADVIRTSRKLDPNNPKVKRLNLEHPERFQMRQPVDVAFFCAGMTDPADCQKQPGHSWEVNVKSQIRLIRELYAQGTFIVYFSSHLIFDGSVPHVQEDARKKPHSRFAEQKVAVEEYLSKLDSSYGILRLSDVIGPNTEFLCRWAQSLKQGEAIQAVRDLSMAPVGLDDVVKAAVQIGTGRKTGIFQLSGDKDVPFDRIAVELSERLGVPSSLVHAIEADEATWEIVARPENTTLNTNRAKRELNFKPKAWSEILSHFIETNRLRSDQPYSSIADDH